MTLTLTTVCLGVAFDSNAAYHGYWPADLFALQDTAANLQALTNALHSRGMALMVRYRHLTVERA